MTAGELAQTIAPPRERTFAARDWIETNLPATDVKMNHYNDTLTVTLSASDAGVAFGCELVEWAEDGGSGRSHVRAASRVRLPDELSSHVQYVAGLREPFPPAAPGFSRASLRRNAPAVGAGGAGSVPCLYTPGPTPDCLRDAYGIDATAASATAGGRMAVAEFAGSFYLESDLAKFELEYGTPKDSVAETQGVVPTSGNAGAEASLDIQVFRDGIAHLRISSLGPFIVVCIPSCAARHPVDHGDRAGRRLGLCPDSLVDGDALPRLVRHRARPWRWHARQGSMTHRMAHIMTEDLIIILFFFDLSSFGTTSGAY